ncbi:hypothetical protein BH24ACT5_BH24ACT5_25210 [soil metagenome]
MSGFLITGLLLKEHAQGGIQLGRFSARRLLRLYPAVLLYLGGVAVAEAFRHRHRETHRLSAQRGTS